MADVVTVLAASEKESPTFATLQNEVIMAERREPRAEFERPAKDASPVEVATRLRRHSWVG